MGDLLTDPLCHVPLQVRYHLWKGREVLLHDFNSTSSQVHVEVGVVALVPLHRKGQGWGLVLVFAFFESECYVLLPHKVGNHLEVHQQGSHCTDETKAHVYYRSQV